MNKQTLIDKIVAQLIAELEGYFKAAQTAHAEATHEQSRAENKYDTRGLEASYLAHGQAQQAVEMEAAIAAFKNMSVRKFGVGEPIGTGALVEVENDGERAFYFIAPRAGGMEMVHEKKAVLVITPQSPLGKQLHEKKQGDLLQLTLGGASKKYRVVKVE
jgi:transcription elongation GreA/GreB family factor